MPSGIGYGAMQGLDQILAKRFMEQQFKQQQLEAERANALATRRLDQDQQQFEVGTALQGTRIGQEAEQNEFGRNLQAANMAMRGTEFSQGVQNQEADNAFREASLGMQGARLAADIEQGNQQRQSAERIAGMRQSGAQGLSPNQELLAINRLSKQWSDSTKNASEIARQVNNMDLGLQAARNGDVAAGAQAVLVTFQKILDPTSVVRESEYARSAAGQSALNQAQGFMERLAKGGVGVPVDELEAFANLARQMAQSAQGGLTGRRARLERTATSYGLDPSLVFDDTVPTDDTAQPTPQATPTQTQPTRPSAQDLINKYRGRR